MIGYKANDWFFIKEKNKFLSIINSYLQGFLLYCVILLSGPMQGKYVKRLRPPTFDPQEDKNKQAASWDRQGMVMTRPQEFSSRVIRGKQK